MSIMQPHGHGKLQTSMEGTEYTEGNVIRETRIVGRIDSRSHGQLAVSESDHMVCALCPFCPRSGHAEAPAFQFLCWMTQSGKLLSLASFHRGHCFP